MRHKDLRLSEAFVLPSPLCGEGILMQLGRFGRAEPAKLQFFSLPWRKEYS
jgi:hypothetical protein